MNFEAATNGHYVSHMNWTAGLNLKPKFVIHTKDEPMKHNENDTKRNLPHRPCQTQIKKHVERNYYCS